MRIPPDIISEILLITKENYEYKKKIAKEKYNNVIKELKDHTCIMTKRHYHYPIFLVVTIARSNKNGQRMYAFVTSQYCYTIIPYNH